MDKAKELARKIQEVQQLLQKQKVKAAATLLNELKENRPLDPNVLVLLGLAALKQNDFTHAQEYLQQAINLDNQLSEAHFYLATLYFQLEQFDKAIEQYQCVSSLDNSHYTAQMNLGLAFESKWRYLEAKIIYEKMLLDDPEDVNVVLHLGNVCLKLGKASDAIKHFEAGLELAPKSIDLLNQLGWALFKANQESRSKKCYHKVLSLKPGNVQALFLLSQQHPYHDKAFPETKALQEILGEEELANEDKILAHFALGKIYDRSEYHERAFFHYEKANSICAQKQIFNEGEYVKKINKIRELFNANAIQQKRILPDESKLKPLFIVGMSGSGKELLCDALGKHGSIAKMGANKLLDELASKIVVNEDLFLKADSETLQAYVNKYLDEISKLALKNAPIVCDNMPDNYLYVGLIAVLFPDSPIIHCTRHPMDLCLANYFHFHGNENTYSHHLVTLGKYYQHYAKLMSYWQSIGVKNRLEVKYEALIDKPGETLKLLFEALNLPPIEPHLVPRYYPYELDRWKKYQHYLQPLIEILYNT
ncbi:MAG: sulfotransferase [Proteobacteria bacterium]|nr:sulfotransferase [Pseudomonadota bacterium]